MEDDYTKCPRLYVPDNLSGNVEVNLSRDHAHYLLNVMRKSDGDSVRVFNGRDGEYGAKISVVNKKTINLKWLKNIKAQPKSDIQTHLYCAPIKKDRFAFMIEKAVELGVTHIHPIITERTQNAKINQDKCDRYIIEATEQCERMDIAILEKPRPLIECKFDHPTYAAIERLSEDSPIFSPSKSLSISIIVGPEGGWSVNEIHALSNDKSIIPVSLGNNVLRAETAALFMLSRIA